MTLSYRAMDKAFSFWTSIDLVGSCWIHRHLIHLLNVLWDLKDEMAEMNLDKHELIFRLF